MAAFLCFSLNFINEFSATGPCPLLGTFNPFIFLIKVTGQVEVIFLCFSQVLFFLLFPALKLIFGSGRLWISTWLLKELPSPELDAYSSNKCIIWRKSCWHQPWIKHAKRRDGGSSCVFLVVSQLFNQNWWMYGCFPLLVNEGCHWDALQYAGTWMWCSAARQSSWADPEKQNSLDVALLLPPCEPACLVLRWASLHPDDLGRTAKLKPTSVQAPLLEGWTTQKSLFITFSKTSLCAGIIKDGINGRGKNTV